MYVYKDLNYFFDAKSTPPHLPPNPPKTYNLLCISVHVPFWKKNNFLYVLTMSSYQHSEIRQKLKEDVAAIRAENEGFKPGLAIVQVTCLQLQFL